MGGFYNVSIYPDDPCSREICLEFAFMKSVPHDCTHTARCLSRPPAQHHDHPGLGRAGSGNDDHPRDIHDVSLLHAAA